jgi:tetrahydromethanopterin S-methyltransferase subunit B
MTITYLNPAVQKMLASIQPHGQTDQAMQATMTVAMSAGAIGGALFGVAIAGVFIVLLTRRSARAFCTGQVIESVPPPLP